MLASRCYQHPSKPARGHGTFPPPFAINIPGGIIPGDMAPVCHLLLSMPPGTWHLFGAVCYQYHLGHGT